MALVIDSTVELDLPARFHDPIVDWVLGRAYHQQDQPEQGIPFLDLFEEALRTLKQHDQRGSMFNPLVVNGGSGSAVVARARFPWE